MPSWTSAMARGLTNVAVPTWTAVHPATRNSSASSARMMPPTPSTGMRTERAAWCARCTASGRMAGPDRPPVRKLSLGLWAFRSIDMPTNVLTAHSASAPAALQSDGVQHPGRCFHDAWWRGSGARPEKYSFGNHSPQSAALQQRNLGPIAESARRGQHRPAKPQPANAHAHVDGHAVTAYG